MSIEIVEVISKKERKAFFAYPLSLYKDNPYYVPSLMMDELELFDETRSPFLEDARAKLYLARRAGTIVGRVAAIMSGAANQKFDTKDVRFCCFDCPDDPEIATRLFDAVERWAIELGMETISGPHGFSNFDKEGMLIEGFEEMPTFAEYYNFPYYNGLVEGFGFRKHYDFVEFCLENMRQTPFPEKLNRIVERVKKRGQFRVVDLPDKKTLNKWVTPVFDLFEETYEDLDDMIPLTKVQREYLLKKFLPILDPSLVKVIVNGENVVVGMMIALPSVSEGLRKSKGRLLPFGWWHLFRCIKTTKTVDLMLIGVKKSFRNKGIDLILLSEMYKSTLARGFDRVESNPELETNTLIQAGWKSFNKRQHKRRRIYIKEVGEKGVE